MDVVYKQVRDSDMVLLLDAFQSAMGQSGHGKEILAVVYVKTIVWKDVALEELKGHTVDVLKKQQGMDVMFTHVHAKTHKRVDGGTVCTGLYGEQAGSLSLGLERLFESITPSPIYSQDHRAPLFSVDEPEIIVSAHLDLNHFTG
ncbi:MAG: hypothetical protein Q9209_007136 [Squamulea sp. 1 TL-2023]